ncbi:MAG: hypothetical protein ETSY1_20265 [Candidatus Entotheonella factor]|uniref:Uncharacterized protein n=1 Tax=Entotheonella factor TaxID=1429438 RepID=W4LIZ0_ENTF1|nr:MAG: hypothetical protein ETSY1_20265 [Candidatus Entotheonella factor]
MTIWLYIEQVTTHKISSFQAAAFFEPPQFFDMPPKKNDQHLDLFEPRAN